MKIITKRLMLRDIRKKDIRSIQKNINNLNISKWLLTVPYPYTKKDALWWVNDCLKKQKKKPRTSYELGIILKPNLEVIGGIGLGNIDIRQRTADIGYWISEKYWRQGIVFEAANELLDFAFKKLKLRKIKIPIFAENEASNRMAKKLGAKFEGKLRKQVIAKSTGKIHDENIYGILKEEWKKLK